MTHASVPRRSRHTRALAVVGIALLTLLVAVWVAPRASGTVAAWVSAPEVQLHTLRAPGGGTLAVARPAARGAGSSVLDAGSHFTMLGVVCDVPTSAGAVSIRLRTSLDGSSWGSWFEAPVEVAGEGAEEQAFTDALWTGEARYVQVAASADADGPSALTNVRLVAIDPTDSGDVAARVTGAVRRVAAAIAGIGTTSPAEAASSKPTIITRSQWGADESLRKAAPSYAAVKMAIIHHTAGGNTYTQAQSAALVRGIYAYHTQSLGWNDIAYNFLIDRYGTIYEGRYGGVSRGVIGAHVYGFNTGSTGISVMGTFTDETPPAAAVTSLKRLLAWKLAVHGLNPTAKAAMTCGAGEKYATGATVKLPVISGHRQANYTACPGDALYALLPSIRTNVATRMGSAITATLTASSKLISPNGDGVRDSTKLRVRISAAASWRVTLTSSAGDRVVSWSGEGTSATRTWKGGSGVADGVYTAELTATPAGGDPVTATVRVTVDTTAPRLTVAAATPTSFSPNGDKQGDTTTVTYAPAETCRVRVGILDANGDVVRWLHGWKQRKAKSYRVAWDGRVSSGGSLVAARDGAYRFDIERKDTAGNIARRGVRITLDRTLGTPTAAPATFSPNGDGVRDATKIGFRLARKATVTVRVLLGDETVRTFSLGSLATGAHTVTWDGWNAARECLASSRTTIVVTAVSSLGQSAVSKNAVVDLSRPRLYAPAAKKASVRTRTRLGVKAVDAYSHKVDVSYVVTDARGRRVASGHTGWARTSRSLSVAWTPRKRGVFTVTYRAVDPAGNRQANTASTAITVR